MALLQLLVYPPGCRSGASLVMVWCRPGTESAMRPFVTLTFGHRRAPPKPLGSPSLATKWAVIVWWFNRSVSRVFFKILGGPIEFFKNTTLF